MTLKLDSLRWWIAMGLLAFVISLFGSGLDEANGQAPSPSTSSRHTKKDVSFDEQWKVFRDLGFELTSNKLAVDLEKVGSDNLISERPFSILYMELGRTIQREPWTPLTNRVWDFDTEAIEDSGDYIEIMRNLERISRGEIEFADLKDYVDIEEGKAWVSFSIKGRDFKWNLIVDDDWADPALFTKIAELTQTLNTRGRYTYFDTGGQNAVIGYETPESLEALMVATGLKIDWLN